ncbi:MAG: hypothetical protein JW772_04185 [Candidatus Diapherotrites archaeon]|nr:hypothetical protein [Candidatus Diapherotrites archaeon]
MPTRFCPNCGTTKGPFFRGFCKKCFLKKNNLISVPEKILLERCKACGKIRVFGKWVSENPENIEKILLKQVKVLLEKPEIKFEISDSGKVIVSAKGFFENELAEVEAETSLDFAETRCDACMKLISYYHEAIIQIRGDNKKKLENALDEAREIIANESKRDSLSAIIDFKKSKNGFDLYIGSKRSAVRAARAIASKHNTSPIVSSKLVGVDKKGKQKKRLTYCVRI